ncbi:MAG: CGNR zinc finger domain-containing protein [Pseudomonadota bacterium]
MRFSEHDWTHADIIGGNAALDFVNTVDKWSSGPIDRLGDAAGMARWAETAGLLYGDDMARAKDELARDPKGAQEFYKAASELRAGLARIFYALASDGDIAEEDLALIDLWKERAARHCRIVRDGDGFRRRCTEAAPALERAARLIVEAAEDFLLNGRLERLHVCGGDSCEWVFVDSSKNGQRRWCSMATCGNEAKVKKHRRLKKKKAA